MGEHWKKSEFSKNEKKLMYLISAKPRKFNALRPYFNSPTTLNKHLISLRQKEIILKNKQNEYEINPERYEGVKIEQINDKIAAFIGSLDENTLQAESISKENNIYSVAIIDYPWGEFDKLKLWKKDGPYHPGKHATVADMREAPFREVKECAQSIKIEGDSISFKAPKMEKGKKFLYFICMGGDKNE